MRTRTWCVVAALVSLSSPAVAQNVISEADALARLFPDSPRVRAIRSAVDVDRAEALTAARWPNPRVTYNRESVAGVTENMVLVTQPLPWSGRRAFDISAASARVAASQLRADEGVRQVRAALRTAYADLVAAQDRETVIAGARDRLRGLVEILVRREEAGDAAGYDRLRAEREVVDLDADLAGARVDRLRAQAELASFLLPSAAGGNLVATGAPASRAPLPPLDDIVGRGLASLPELAALKQDVASAGFAVQSAERRRVPEPEVVAGTKSSDTAGGDIGTVLSVHVAVPLFDRARPERAIARAQRAEAEARLAAIEASLRSRIAGGHAIVTELRQAADAYRSSTVANSTQLERIAQVSYDAGERGVLELLDAFRSSAAARLRQVSLDATVRHAEIELELVSGQEIP